MNLSKLQVSIEHSNMHRHERSSIKLDTHCGNERFLMKSNHTQQTLYVEDDATGREVDAHITSFKCIVLSCVTSSRNIARTLITLALARPTPSLPFFTNARYKNRPRRFVIT